VREAAMLALREDMQAQKVTKEHFIEAMKKVPPSVSKIETERYNKIEENYLKHARAATLQAKSYAG
jgi:transitional endoplasmic reticulum ATPase